MLIRSLPHQTNIGKREAMQMPTAIFRLSGHASRGPTGVAAQSKESRTACMPEEDIGTGTPAGWSRSEAVERGRVIHEDTLPGRFVARPLLQQVEEDRVVGLGVPLRRMRPIAAPQQALRGDLHPFARDLGG